MTDNSGKVWIPDVFDPAAPSSGKKEIRDFMPLKVEKVTASNQKEVISFLFQHEDTAIFLLGNLHEHGPHLGIHVNSGNFKLIRKNEKIVCVFCLTRRGTLLVQSELLHPTFDVILGSCKEEPYSIRGIIGDWKFAKDFWQFLKNHKIIKKDNFYSKEINYTLVLDDCQSCGAKEAKLLQVDDYERWKALRIAYLLEQELPQDLSDKEMKEQFIGKCEKLMIWGSFLESQLISIAELNARTDGLATVGSVYTIPKWRRKGSARVLMNQLIFDCRNKLSIDKLIIFTGENKNKPAQKLYESLGCIKVGYMALFFGE